MKTIRWGSSRYSPFASYPKLEDMTELVPRQNLTLKRIAYKEKKFLQGIQLEFSGGLVSPIYLRGTHGVRVLTDKSSDSALADFKNPKYFEFD